MTNSLLKNISDRLNAEKGKEAFSLDMEERAILGQTLDTYLDQVSADHVSSHQNNHQSSPK